MWSWKLSRSNTLSQDAIIAINDAINNIDVIHESYYQKIDRTDTGCFYYPTPDSDSEVIFPGQCDDNIQAVNNFRLQDVCLQLYYLYIFYIYFAHNFICVE